MTWAKWKAVVCTSTFLETCGELWVYYTCGKMKKHVKVVRGVKHVYTKYDWGCLILDVR